MNTTIPINQTTTANISIANGSTGINYGWSNLAGDITVKGRSLTETLERIEERLAILVPNVRLEQDWKELQNLRQQYVELERKLLEQQRVFDILKKSY